ncbi:ATP-binding protein [Photobacterium sp. TY1-4]|uniref:ATP-binding protein n=1 Tax=Photobacterium sp. TY1-4 TaxID=2899122 RepID=UPI0021C06DA5|nr:ATP-binding protein [Photobacterium sp. TY1-4]UXI02172.1 ATP-binding protein [Photobacterium sp. TY1-4]
MLKQVVSLVLVLTTVYILYTRVVVPSIGVLYYQEVAEDKARDWRGTYLLLQRLYPTQTAPQWQALLEQVRQTSNIPIEARPLAQWQLPEQGVNILLKGEIWVADWQEDITYQLIGGDVVARIGPIGTTDSAMMIYAFATKYLPLLFIVTITLGWALWLQYRLQRLEQISVSFSQGDFHTRAPEGALALGDLNRAFNRMAERLKRLFLSQKHLTNAVSHELRSPIARLRFQLEMLIDEKDEAAIQSYIAGMSEDLDDMDEMIDEMLTYAKMERTEPLVQLERIAICQWLQSQQQYLLGEIDMAMRLKLPTAEVQVAADPALLSRLLRNLVSNAGHYAVETLVVGIDVTDDSCCLWVDDDGPGIPQEQRQQLFEPFTRLDSSRNKNSGGYGLGLAIVAQIARCHRGQVEIQESAYGGTRMLFRWPLK